MSNAASTVTFCHRVKKICGYRSGHVRGITYVFGQSLTMCYSVSGRANHGTTYYYCKHIITVPELDETEQQHAVRARARSWVSS